MGRGREKSYEWLLAHPFQCENGLLSTLSGKGWTKGPFSGGSSSQCEALRAFFTLLGHFGSFWCLKPQNLLSPESAKSHGTGPPKPNGTSKNGEKHKIRPPGAVWSVILERSNFDRF